MARTRRVGPLQRILSRRVEQLCASLRNGRITEDEVYHAFGMQSHYVAPTPRGFYRLSMCSVGNPDYGQRCRQSDPKTMELGTLRECRDAVREYIAKWDLGSGNWSDDSGTVSDANGVLLGRFSYNARFWPTANATSVEFEQQAELRREDKAWK